MMYSPLGFIKSHKKNLIMLEIPLFGMLSDVNA